MATSVDDLLATLQHESTQSSKADPGDASLALDWCGRLLTHLRTAGIGADAAPSRDDVTRRLGRCLHGCRNHL